MKRLALWCARHALISCAFFYRYGLGTREVVITVEWMDLEEEWVIQPADPRVLH